MIFGVLEFCHCALQYITGDIVAAHRDAPDPIQVVESYLFDGYIVRIDGQLAGNAPLRRHRIVAQPDGGDATVTK